MDAHTLFLGGSLHGRRLRVDGKPEVYQYRLPQAEVKPAKLNGCNATSPRRRALTEQYRRVWVESAGVAVYLAEGYDPGEEDQQLLSDSP